MLDIEEQDQLQNRAHITNLPEDWHHLRHIRNTARGMIKADKFEHNREQFMSINPNVIWSAAQQLDGMVAGGPHSQRMADGVITNLSQDNVDPYE